LNELIVGATIEKTVVKVAGDDFADSFLK